MPTRPTNRNLFIPGKNYVGAHDGYQKDMQSLEIWARQPIQQLIAGSGITLSPASGLATDSRGRGPNPITISASGGGGGSEPGFMGVQAAPTIFDFSAGGFYMPLSGTDQTFGPSGTVTNFPIFPDNGNYHDFGINMFCVSWFAFIAAGSSANTMPLFGTPSYTSPGGHQIKVQYTFWACDPGFTNYVQWIGTTPNIPSFSSYQAVVGDLTGPVPSPVGTDLTLTAGTFGNSSSGLVSTAGGIYFGGIAGLILTSTDMTFP